MTLRRCPRCKTGAMLRSRFEGEAAACVNCGERVYAEDYAYAKSARELPRSDNLDVLRDEAYALMRLRMQSYDPKLSTGQLAKRWGITDKTVFRTLMEARRQGLIESIGHHYLGPIQRRDEP